MIKLNIAERKRNKEIDVYYQSDGVNAIICTNKSLPVQIVNGGKFVSTIIQQRIRLHFFC